MKIHTVVVTYNAKTWVPKCLGSLLQSKMPTDIFVIDNNSSDGTPELIRTSYPTVNVLVLDRNLGFGRANNVGLRIALQEDADFIFLLNQDCRIESDTIEQLVNCHEDDYAIISPIHLNGAGTSFDFGYARYLQDSLTREMLFELYTCNCKSLYPTSYVNAAAWMISRKALQTIGGFDPSFFMYGEDDNYLLRTIYHQLKIGFCFTAKIYHDREDRQNSQMGDYYFRKVRLTVLLRDINHPIHRQVIKLLYEYIRNIIESIIMLRLREAALSIRLFAYVAYDLPSSIRARMQARTKSLPFL